jgi:hypothetical protein
MERVLQDLRYAGRRLRGRPGFSAIAIVSLALGIGANTAIFSLVQALILREPAVREPERVVEVYAHTHEFKYLPFSIPDYRDFERATKDVFSTSYGVVFSGVPRDRGDHVDMVPVDLVTGNYFVTLGIEPALGRLFSPADDVARRAPTWCSATATGRPPTANARAQSAADAHQRSRLHDRRRGPVNSRAPCAACHRALHPLQMINVVQPTGATSCVLTTT